jgi:predicted amidohydrolase
MKSLKVAAAQMKFRAAIAENLESISSSIAKAARAKCDVILFPECALTGYNIDFSNLNPIAIEVAIRAVAQLARKHRINVIIGAPRVVKRKLFNSLIVIDRRGREIFQYDKIHLTARDAAVFAPGNRLPFFHIDHIPCTSIICHERRFPELVRLPVMMGAQVLFHANAGLDSLAVSKTKRNGRDGIATRAFENQIFYVFANSVGPQGDNLWSAGDSKIIAPDMTTLALANNRDEALIHATLDLSLARRKYALESLAQPAFLRPHWRALLAACRKQLKRVQTA